MRSIVDMHHQRNNSVMINRVATEQSATVERGLSLNSTRELLQKMSTPDAVIQQHTIHTQQHSPAAQDYAELVSKVRQDKIKMQQSQLMANTRSKTPG